MILKCRTVAKKLETHSAFELMMEITLWTDLHTTKQWGIMHKLSPATTSMQQTLHKAHS